MQNFFSTANSSAIPLIPILADEFDKWLEQENTQVKNWVKTVKFTAKPESYCVIPNADGAALKVLIGLKDKKDFWSFGALPFNLPMGCYELDQRFKELNFAQVAQAWGLGAYQFTRYKKSDKTPAQLFIPSHEDLAGIENYVNAIFWVRDLINTPTEDMTPGDLADAAKILVSQFRAQYHHITGADLLKQNYPSIYTVGRASHYSPYLIDLHWGDVNAPKVTLVGKGVCFDSGGLNLKPTSGMAQMKKDMAGAAHVLGLSRMIVAANLPIRLRVLIPAVENAVSGNAYRPGDVITTRKGITVEVTNTDAEGRLILCDALAEAASENPELLIDIATLTGAARIAVGTDISAMFTNNNELANELLNAAETTQDPICRLPLYAPYRKLLDSTIADIANASNAPYGGAITAALFLKEFVPADIRWAHFDIMAWNAANRPGRPEGGEAMAIHALFHYLQKKFRR